MRNFEAAWMQAIKQYLDHLVAGGRRPATIRLRSYWLQRAAVALGGSPWTTQPNDVVSWAAAQPWGAETRRSVRTTLRCFWKWAVDARHTSENPALALPAVPMPRAVPKPTPDSVVERALAIASDRDELMIRLAAHAGLRRGEIARIRWDHILDSGWLVVDGKGGNGRYVPLHPQILQLLDQERALRCEGQLGDGWRYHRMPDAHGPWVFPGLRGGHLREETVGDILKRCLVGWSGHTLRHRFATRTLRGSRDIRAVQTLLGHASVETTQRYTAVVEDDLVEAVRWAA